MELTIDKIHRIRPAEPKPMTAAELRQYFSIKQWKVYEIFKSNKDKIIKLNGKRAMSSLDFWSCLYEQEV